MKLYLFFLSCAVALYAAPPLKIDSDEVEYDGKVLHLQSNVIVESEMGVFNADRVDWTESSEEISLSGNVRSELKSGAILTCESAECNLFTGQIALEGRVVLNDPTHKVEAQKMALVINEAQKNVQYMKIDGGVKFTYRNGMTAVADCAVYKRNSEISSSALFGIFKLMNEKGYCEFSNTLGDRFLAKEISIDFVNSRAEILYPKGTFQLDNESIDFSADRLVWDQITEKFHLQNQVIAKFHEMGQFTVEKELELSYQTIEGKRELKRVECLGKTEFALDEKKHLSSFVCHGKICVDPERNEIVMTSPVNTSGFTDRRFQVYIKDGLAKMAADKVSLYFAGEKPVLDKVLLEGHVQLINRLTQVVDTDNPWQYALADTIEYLPKTKELNLYSTGKHRVLFQDTLNQLHISATGLRMKRSTPAQRGYIQGVGDVRFSFAKNEIDSMKDAFFNG